MALYIWKDKLADSLHAETDSNISMVKSNS